MYKLWLPTQTLIPQPANLCIDGTAHRSLPQEDQEEITADPGLPQCSIEGIIIPRAHAQGVKQSVCLSV